MLDLQRHIIGDAFLQRMAKESVDGIAGYTLMSNPDDYDEIAETNPSPKHFEVLSSVPLYAGATGSWRGEYVFSDVSRTGARS
jgi:hypothetical protein